MNLHSQIMNIQIDKNELSSAIIKSRKSIGSIFDMLRLSYKEGHKDARHKAAELALKVKE